MTNARDQIVATTCALLESQGYHATGLSQIVKESGSPKGSLYYYFPEGKEAIAEEAVRHVTGIVVERIRANLAEATSPAEGMLSFTHTVSHHMEASGFQSGGPLTTIALETAITNERLNLVCRECYEQMRRAFEEKLLAHHFPAPLAAELSLTILAAMEGGILLSRTYHSGDPLRSVGSSLAQLLQTIQNNLPR